MITTSRQDECNICQWQYSMPLTLNVNRILYYSRDVIGQGRDKVLDLGLSLPADGQQCQFHQCGLVSSSQLETRWGYWGEGQVDAHPHHATPHYMWATRPQPECAAECAPFFPSRISFNTPWQSISCV